MVELETESVDEDIIDQGDVDKKTIEKEYLKIVIMKQISTADIIIMGDLEEAVEKIAEFETRDHLNEESKSQCLLSIFFLGDLDEGIKKNTKAG